MTTSNITEYTNTRVLISKIPEGVAPNKDHFKTITVTETKPVLEEGSVFVKNVIFSLDPYIRHEFLPGTTQTPVIGFGIAKVLQSSNASFPVGSTFFGNLPWETYTTLSATALALVVPLQLDSELPLSVYNGVLGTSGFTVWDSLRRVADLKAGETIYISSAAGTLGQVAGQLAKRKGLRVIGSAGSDEKVAFLTSTLGFDAAFNYKTQDPRSALTSAVGPAGLDIYYDLVFDSTLETVLDILNPHGRIISVGIVAAHQGQAVAAPKNLVNILMKQLRFEGYTVYENFDQWGLFCEEMTPLVKSGEIKYAETVVEGGVDVVVETYLNVMKGVYKGKVSVLTGAADL
ncbi:alcohol dehydrogenase [Linnemannia elongata]|nr:alcohol dehydrogenase [Linnemannia elongata]